MANEDFKYPGSDFDRARVLVAALGSFWARTYTAADQVTSYAISTAQQVNQTYRNLLETVAALSRYDIPLFHEEVLTPITIKKSALNTTQSAQALFDDTDKTLNGELRFDLPEQTELFYAPLPDKLVDVGQLFNQITFPTVALVRNTDFAISSDRQALVLRDDPFANPAFVKRAVVTDGQPDEEITLWGFFGKFDYDYVFNQFAYAVGIQLQTSQGYKDLVNAVITGLVNGGAAAADIDAALSAICGLPISAAVEETVEAVTYDRHGLLIITNENVYRFSSACQPVVKEGQKIVAGAQLVAGISVAEFFVGNRYIKSPDELVCLPPRGDVVTDFEWTLITDESGAALAVNTDQDLCEPARKKLTGLTVGPEFLSACFYSELVFENKEVPLEVDTHHASGFTYVKFAVGGFPEDVTAFFDEMHRRGIAAYENRDSCADKRRYGTLAQILDKRKNVTSEPGPENLPKTINPMRFIVENVLRNNVFIVRIDVEALGQNRLGLYNIRHIRPLIPPHSAMIVVFELGARKDAVTGSEAVREQIDIFTGANPLYDVIPQTAVRDSVVSVRLVSGTCQ